MSDTDLFLSTNPAEPWSAYPLGPAALGLVAVGLVALTLWTYLGHPQANRRRVIVVVVLRLLALLVALLTALRPSVGVQEDPKLPSVLLIGVDMSESMTVPDELNKPRIDAVRKVLERCQPTLEELEKEQNVSVVMYGFGPADFNEAANRYDPAAPPKFNRSDYAAYLKRTFDRWQGERFLRGHLIIGDGAHNGDSPPEPEAARWRQAGRALHTFAVGDPTTLPDVKDVAITSVATTSGNPDGSVFVKTEFTLKIVVNGYGFKGVKVPVKVEFDEGDGNGYKNVSDDTEALLSKEKDNEVELKLKAPEKPGEIKVRVSIPPERLPEDKVPSNNTIETFVQVTKEGMRVLIVNRLSFEHAAVRRALQADPRIDLYQVIRQTDDPPTAQEREDFDFENRAYDVIILGNVSAKQLTSIDPMLPRRIAEQVTKKGVGLLMTGGHASFLGTPGLPDATGWRGTREVEDILPVDLGRDPPVPDAVFTNPGARYQFLPTTPDHYLTRLGNTPAETAALWGRLNDRDNHSRFTGLSKVGRAKPNATVFAVASGDRAPYPVPVPRATADKLAPVMVGHQIGVGNRGRVLVMAAQDTYMWQKLGQPKSNDGIQLHAKFWRQMVRWLAHQEEDDAAAFARPELKRLPVGGKQTIRVGLRQPGGAPAQEPKFEVKVVAPGEDPAKVAPRSPVPDPDGGFKLPYDPSAPGEYTVQVTAVGKDKEGKEVTGEASARFLAYPEVSDEMMVKAANYDVLKRIARDGGGQFHRLEDLPAFLKELKATPIETAKPKPRYLPDWRRDHSKGFLPGWLVLFAVLLAAEWGLRRLWGMV